MRRKRTYSARAGVAGYIGNLADVRRDPSPIRVGLSAMEVERLAAELGVIGISAEVTIRNKAIGSHFVSRRYVLKLDSETLAKRLRTDVKIIAEIEESKRLPTVEMLKLASQVLETSPSGFFSSEVKGNVRSPQEALPVANHNEKDIARVGGFRENKVPLTHRAKSKVHRKGTNMFKIAEYMLQTYGVVVEIDGRQLGANIRDIKLSKQIDTGQLAEAVGLNYPQVYIIETGLNPPSLDRFLQIADKLETHPSRFFDHKGS